VEGNCRTIRARATLRRRETLRRIHGEKNYTHHGSGHRTSAVVGLQYSRILNADNGPSGASLLSLSLSLSPSLSLSHTTISFFLSLPSCGLSRIVRRWLSLFMRIRVSVSLWSRKIVYSEASISPYRELRIRYMPFFTCVQISCSRFADNSNFRTHSF